MAEVRRRALLAVMVDHRGPWWTVVGDGGGTCLGSLRPLGLLEPLEPLEPWNHPNTRLVLPAHGHANAYIYKGMHALFNLLSLPLIFLCPQCLIKLYLCMRLDADKEDYTILRDIKRISSLKN